MDIHRGHKTLNQNFITYTNINSRLVMNLDLNIKLYKLLEKDIGENLRHLGLGKDFLGLMQKHHLCKEKLVN